MKLIKLWMFLAVIAMFPISSRAEKPSKEEWQGLCKKMAQTGAVIMKGRQQGLSMIKSMEVAGHSGSMSEYVKTLVVQAYDRPRYQTQVMQQQEVQDFEDTIFKGCLAQYKG